MRTRLIPGRFRILSGGPFEKPVFPFTFRFRPPSDPAAAALRKQYRLLEIAGEGSDFARARRLKSWVRRQWNHGYHGAGDQDTTPQDALDILAQARQGRAFSCWYYRRTFVQCCLAIGLPAREMGVSRKATDLPDSIKGNQSHAVAEVYCREIGKWVMLDSDINAFYTVNGIPANVLEVHRAWHENRGKSVKQVLDNPKFVSPSHSPIWDSKAMKKVLRDFTRHRTIDFYDHVFTHLLNGFSDPPLKIGQKCIWYVGKRPPLLLMDYYGNDLDRFLFVEEESHFNWPLQRTYILANMKQGKPSNRLEIRLEHTMPFFDHFELSVGHQSFNRLRGNRASVSMPAGETLFRARGVDSFGRKGIEATLKVELQPATPEVLAVRKKEGL